MRNTVEFCVFRDVVRALRNKHVRVSFLSRRSEHLCGLLGGTLREPENLPKSSKFDHFRRGCGGSDNVPKKWCRGARVRLHMHVRSLVVGDSRSAEGCLYVCVPDLLHCSADVCACVYTQVVLRSVCFRFFARVHARVFQVCFPPTCSAVIET